MWREIDEGIRSRIITNVESSARAKAVLYTLILAAVSGVMFFASTLASDDGLISPLMIALFLVFLVIGLVAILYIYFSTVNEKTAIAKEANCMVLGKIVSKSDNGFIVVKLPGEKATYRIACDRELYESAKNDYRVLVVASSKRNSNKMIGVNPATYDKDGIL